MSSAAPDHKAKPVTRNILWILFDKTTRLITAVVVTAAVARHVGPTEYSRIAFYTTLAAGALIFSQFGMERVLVTRFSRNQAAYGRLRDGAILLRVVGAILGAGLAWLVAGTVPPTSSAFPPYYTLVPLLYSTLFFPEINEYQYHATGTSRKAAQARIIANIALAFSRIILLAINAPTEYYVGILCIEPIAYLMGIHKAAAGGQTRIRFRVSRTVRVARALAKSSSALFLSALSVFMYTKADQLIVTSLASASEAGLYAAITPFSNQNIFILPAAITTAFLPLMASRQQQSERQQVLIMNLAAVLFTIIPVVALLELAAPTLLTTLLGKSYSQGVVVLRIHLLTCLFSGLNLVQNNWLIQLSKSNYVLLKTLLSAATGLTAVICLVPDFGAIGAAWGAVFAEATAFVVGLYYSKPTFPSAFASSMSVDHRKLFHYLKRGREF